MNSNLRIVSLISSGTEILCRLGLEKQIVGISHECDYPPSICNLPRLSRPKINPESNSKTIHQDVMDLIQKGLSIYEIDTERLRELKPDLIVTQDQCEVCAVSLKDVESAICKLTENETVVCSLKPHSLDDIATDIRKVGRFTNRYQNAEDLVTKFWIQLNGVNARAGTSGYTKPRVLCIEWLDPLIVGGGWIPEIVTLAGGEPLIVTRPERFQKITWEEAFDVKPDMIVIMPCGYSMEKTRQELLGSKIAAQLKQLMSPKSARCFITDGNQYFNRPGPRIADSTEILASLFQPDKFQDFYKKYLNTGFLEWSP